MSGQPPTAAAPAGHHGCVRRGNTVTFAELPPKTPRLRPPPARVAVMLALAHKIQEAIDRRVVSDRAEVARILGVTRARVTQLLDLTLLPVDVQARILLAEAVDGREPVTERGVREAARGHTPGNGASGPTSTRESYLDFRRTRE